MYTLISVAGLTAIVVGALYLTAKADTFRPTVNTTPKYNRLNALYIKYGNIYSIDPYLLKAIAFIESSENPYAYNKESDCIGLMQILCQPDGHGGCRNKFNIKDWPPDNKDQLFDAEYNIHIGTQILKWNISKYGLNKGIAVYNSWSARFDPYSGPFRNQSYVDKVMKKYQKLKKKEALTL